jgi:GT2 family glycosyltransferase
VTLVSIIIVSFNARADLAACLRSLTDTPPAVEHEIVVVDNASSDGSVEVTRVVAGVRPIALVRNLGFAAANNAGIRASRGNLLLLLNSDTIVRDGAIDRLVERLLAVPEARVAGPRLIDGAGRIELSWGRMISPLNELRQKILVRWAGRQSPSGRRLAERLTGRERFVDWVSGACLLVHRADAEAVGLLDERFFLYTEDVDFCAAIRARGGRILFTPAAQIVHLRGRSRATAPAPSQAAYRRSHLAFYEKHHPAWAPVLRFYLRLSGDLPGEGAEQAEKTDLETKQRS